MLYRVCLIGPVIAAGIILAPAAHADDAAVEAIKKAIQVEREAVAYRIKKSSIDQAHQFAITEVTIEVINPDRVHVTEIVDGKLRSESVTDGQRLFVRQGPKGEV